MALTVSGVSSVASVEMKDSGSLQNFALMTQNDWGYSLETQGTAFVAPLTVRVTNEQGQSITASIPSITPNAVINTGANL